MPGLRGSATISNLFMTDVPGRTVKEKLKNKIYQYTGVRGDSEQLLYLIETIIGACGCSWIFFMVVP